MDIKVIKLIGEVEVQVDFDDKPVPCRKCKKFIRFGISRFGKFIPINMKGALGDWQVHFDACKPTLTPQQKRVKAKKEKQAKGWADYNKLSPQEQFKKRQE